VKGVQIDDGEGGSGSVQQKMTSYRDDLGDIQSMYTLKVQIDPSDSTQGIIKGGLGIGADESTGLVDAGFDVDTFWVGRLGQKTFPFIIDSDTGETFIDEAVIQSLTFNKMRSEDGTLAFTPTVYDGLGNVTEAGKLKAEFIDVNNLVATQAKSSNFVTGSAGWQLAANGSAELQDVTVRGDVEATSLKADTLMVDEGHIVDASVDTLQIAGNAVTLLQAQTGGSYTGSSGWRNLINFTYYTGVLSGDIDVLVNWGGIITGGKDASSQYYSGYSRLAKLRIVIGGSVGTTLYARGASQRIGVGMAQKYSFGNAGVQVRVQYYGESTTSEYSKPQARHVYATVIGVKR